MASSAVCSAAGRPASWPFRLSGAPSGCRRRPYSAGCSTVGASKSAAVRGRPWARCPRESSASSARVVCVPAPWPRSRRHAAPGSRRSPSARARSSSPSAEPMSRSTIAPRAPARRAGRSPRGSGRLRDRGPRHRAAAAAAAAREQRVFRRELLAHDDDLFPLAGRARSRVSASSRAVCRNCSLLPQTKNTSRSFSFRSRRSGSREMAMRTRSAAWSYRPYAMWKSASASGSPWSRLMAVSLLMVSSATRRCAARTAAPHVTAEARPLVRARLFDDERALAAEPASRAQRLGVARDLAVERGGTACSRRGGSASHRTRCAARAEGAQTEEREQQRRPAPRRAHQYSFSVSTIEPPFCGRRGGNGRLRARQASAAALRQLGSAARPAAASLRRLRRPAVFRPAALPRGGGRWPAWRCSAGGGVAAPVCDEQARLQLRELGVLQLEQAAGFLELRLRARARGPAAARSAHSTRHR